MRGYALEELVVFRRGVGADGAIPDGRWPVSGVFHSGRCRETAPTGAARGWGLRGQRLLSIFVVTAAVLSAQPGAGIPPEWETRKLLDSLVSNSQKLGPLVAEINPSDWKEKGAPDAYQAQWRSVRGAIGGLQTASSQLAKEPTRLSLALDTLFRLDGLNVYLGSLASGVRRYQNPALADLLLGVADENAANRESLKQYALDLASTKEGELKVMETEAQRCLSIIVKQPPVAKPRTPASPKVIPKDPK